jgi:hypothetical protein
MHLTHLLTIAFRLRTPYSWLQAIDAESCTDDNILAEGDDSASWVVQTIWHNAVQGQTWCKTARTFSIY